MRSEEATITKFIAANLDRIERLAREATPGPWVHDGKWPDGDRVRFGKGGYSVALSPSGLAATFDPPDAAHIAANDPAHVLAWVAALRAVVEMHGMVPEPAGYCRICDTPTYPCPTIRALAAIFADQPGYDEEWRTS